MISETYTLESFAADDVVSNLTEISRHYELGVDYGQAFFQTLTEIHHRARFSRINDTPHYREFIRDYVEAYRVILKQLHTEDKLYAIQYLFGLPTPLAQTVIDYKGVPQNPIHVFTYRHKKRNFNLAGEISRKLMTKVQNVFITGPMNSGKSDLVLSANALLKEAYGGNVFVTIFEGMNESSLHSRTLHSTDIEAKRINLQKLDEYVDEIDITGFTRVNGQAGGVLIIEEATFLSFDEEDKEYLKAIVAKANQKGLSIIFLGLDSNYLAEQLMLTETIQELCGEQNIYPCTSFRVLSYNHSTKIKKAHRTARYYGEGIVRGFNWGQPIVVPRSANLFNYLPVPEKYHPVNILTRAGYHDLAGRLNSYQSQKLLEGFEAMNSEDFADPFSLVDDYWAEQRQTAEA